MKIVIKGVFSALIIAGMGLAFAACKGNSVPVATPLPPEGTPIQPGGSGQPGTAAPEALAQLGMPKEQLDLQTVAKVTLTKTEVIFVKQLRLDVERRTKLQEMPPIGDLELRRMVLDAMINERLVLQASERDGISLSNAEFDQRLQMIRSSAGRPVTDQEFSEGIEKQYGMTFSVFQTYLREELLRQKYVEQYITRTAEKAGSAVSNGEIEKEIQQLRDEMAAQAGRQPTTEEFNEFVKRQGMDITTLREQIRKQLMVQNYLISLAGGPPSEEDILSMYNRNKARFIRPDTISFDWIRIPFGANAEAKTRAQSQADALARDINGKASVFNEKSAIAEAANNSGSARYIQLSAEDPRIQQVFGMGFIDKAMPLEENAVSGVIETPQGFYIIKITRKYRQANLGLDDIYRWGAPTTVREVINSQLMQRVLNNGAGTVTSNLAQEIRAQGTVEINENFLIW